jgi:hypothetical protein
VRTRNAPHTAYVTKAEALSREARVSENGVNHTDGVCDNCGARGKLGWVVGYRDLSHRHACTKPECRDALERADAASE